MKGDSENFILERLLQDSDPQIMAFLRGFFFENILFPFQNYFFKEFSFSFFSFHVNEMIKNEFWEKEKKNQSKNKKNSSSVWGQDWQEYPKVHEYSLCQAHKLVRDGFFPCQDQGPISKTPILYTLLPCQSLHLLQIYIYYIWASLVSRLLLSFFFFWNKRKTEKADCLRIQERRY